MSRHKITVHGGEIELRGYADNPEIVRAIAAALQSFDVMVVVSPADAAYNPFALEDL